MTRIPAELHRQLAIEAAEAGISLNRLTDGTRLFIDRAPERLEFSVTGGPDST